MKPPVFQKKIYNILFLIMLFNGCEKKESTKPQPDPGPETGCRTENFFAESTSRNFHMGFTTWPFGPNAADVNQTYLFIQGNADIYAEHLDHHIPWKAWMNGTELPPEFARDILSRVVKRPQDHKMLLSVSLLNTDRSDLIDDYDGWIPEYTSLNDTAIELAYTNHVRYLIDAFSPDYLVVAIEVNELHLKAGSKWEGYKSLMQKVKTHIKQEYPLLPVSESITLHNLYNPEVADPEATISEIVNYANQMDFVAISYYPFFKGQHTAVDFQKAFDFLHGKITKSIAFVETAHFAETLAVAGYNLLIPSDACEQNAYLETLLTNAQNQDYEFVIWWAHRDFDALWETFPDEVKDLGKIWRDTGLLDENGQKRDAYFTWNTVLKKDFK